MKVGYLKGWIRLCLGFLIAWSAMYAAAQKTTTWRFDNINVVDGHPTHVVGHPQLVDSPYGQAIAFNGVGDAIFVDAHPLAGASQYTWEMIFRPDADGAQAQRVFHLSEQDPATGKDTDNRMLFEIRIVKGQWCLDSFAGSHGESRALLNCDKLYPLDRWYRVTAVYDGTMLRNYVGDELQGEGSLHLVPEGAGHSSIGTRINQVDFFKGAMLEARFVDRALKPEEFLKMPPTIK